MVNAIDSTSERLSEFIERTEVKDFKYFPDRKGHLLMDWSLYKQGDLKFADPGDQWHIPSHTWGIDIRPRNHFFANQFSRAKT